MLVELLNSDYGTLITPLQPLWDNVMLTGPTTSTIERVPLAGVFFSGTSWFHGLVKKT